MRDNSLLSGERQVHENYKGIEYWHKWRYLQALDYVRGKSVLDVGCGCGYGSLLMSVLASNVIGIDDSQEAIDYAYIHWIKCFINYISIDFLSKEPIPIDVIIAFEVIEHIEDTNAVFQKFKAFNPEKIIISVPHNSTPIGANRFHCRHFGVDEILERFAGIGYKPLRLELRYFDTDMISKNNLNIFGVMEKA